MTLQTLAVLTLGALFGARLAAATVALYLGEGLIGLPVFAGAVAGPAYVAGPTGGYLVGFLLAAALVGWLAERGWTRGWLLALAAMTLGHVVIFVAGFAWLAPALGAGKAWAVGVAPFAAATLAKTLLAAALAIAARRFAAARERRLSGASEPASEARAAPSDRAAFARFVPLTTRWNDNDPYGHLNNVAYYAFFDAAVNAILVEAGLLDPASSPVIGLVVESGCRFHSSLSFPDPVEVGVAVERLGRSSVRYRLAVFKAGAARRARKGDYTHVYVERATGRPTPIPAAHRRLMETMTLR